MLSHTKQMLGYGDCLLRLSQYCSSGPYSWREHSVKRLFSSFANTDDQFLSNASEKQKALKKKKEEKRTERLAKQRINELKRNVCVSCVL